MGRRNMWHSYLYCVGFLICRGGVIILEVSSVTFFNFHKVMRHLGLSVTKIWKTRKKGKSRVRANIHRITLLVIKTIDLQRRMCHSACGEGKRQLFGMALLHLNNRKKCFGAIKNVYFSFIGSSMFLAKMHVSQKMTILIFTIFPNGWEVKFSWGQSSQPLSLMGILCIIYIYTFYFQIMYLKE